MAPEIDLAAVADKFYVFPAGGRLRQRWHLNKLRLFELAGLSREHVVLDAGCGAGNLVFMIAPYCRTAIGCDLFHDRLAFGSRRGRGRYVQATIDQLPFSDASFARVFCLEVIEHLELSALPMILSEVRRILKPGGRCLFTTPNYRGLWPVIEFVMDSLHVVPHIPGGAHLAKYRRHTLLTALQGTGLRIVRAGSFNQLSPFVALLSQRWAEHLYRWELQDGRFSGSLLYALCEKP